MTIIKVNINIKQLLPKKNKYKTTPMKNIIFFYKQGVRTGIRRRRRHPN